MPQIEISSSIPRQVVASKAGKPDVGGAVLTGLLVSAFMIGALVCCFFKIPLSELYLYINML